MPPSAGPTRRLPAALKMEPVSGPVGGTVVLPGSKSITNRSLLIAGLASGRTVIDNALYCEDSRLLAAALRDLGVEVEEREAEKRFVVVGAGGPFPRLDGRFELGNAGTSTRFLTAALTLAPGVYLVDGNQRMRERPIGELVRALRILGAVIRDTRGCPPVHIGDPSWSSAAGRPSRSPVQGGTVTMGGLISSQFISAILLAAPYMPLGVEVVIEGHCVSRPYLDITLEVMKQFGARVWADDGRSDGRTAFAVKARSEYSGRHYVVEGDASSASYFLAAAAITGGKIRVEGVGRDSIQGDARFADVLASMGCHVKKDADVIGLSGDRLRGVEIDCSEMPDIVPTLAVVALFARSRTRIRNVAHLRFKESDRISCVAGELRKLGGKVRELEDGLQIEPAELKGAELDTWGDHRLAMAFSLVGLCVPDVVIRSPGVVEKSFPDYFERLERLGVRSSPIEVES